MEPEKHQRRIDRLTRLVRALHEYRDRCRCFQENTRDFVIIASREGEIIHLSPTGHNLLGYQQSELADIRIEDLLDENSRNSWSEFTQSIQDTGRDAVLVFNTKTGNSVEAEGRVILPVLHPGTPQRIFGIFHDATETRKMRKTLAETEQRAQAVFENVPDSVFVKDMDLRYTHVNPAVEKLFDMPISDLIGKTDGDLFGEEVGKHIDDVDGGVLRGNVLEEDHTKPVNGRMKTFHVVKVPIRDKKDRIVGLCGIARDITERKQAEEALRKSEAKWRQLFESLPGGSFSVSDENVIVDVNDVLCKTTGYSKEELIGSNCDIICPKGPHLCPIFHVGKKQIDNDETAVKTRDGRFVPVLKSARRLMIGDREIVVENFQDITRQKEAARALREREEAIHALLNATPEAMYMLDIEGRILSLNTPFANRVGRSVDELVGTNCYEHLPDDIEDENRFHIQRVFRSGRPSRFEISRDGRYLDNNIWPVRNDDGVVDRVVVSSHDITEQKLLEERLNQTAKLEAISQLAGGIAHDFNNLLTGILGYADMLKEGEISAEVAHNAACTIEKAARRAAELTQQLLGFARKGKHQILPIAIDTTINEVIGLLSRTIDKSICIELDLNGNDETVMGDPGQIHQVFLNLALNARDAMPNGGVLKFSTDTCKVDEDISAQFDGIRPGRYLSVHISDTGCGIPKDILPNIFDPFFTTKGQGQGTGMGLAMVYGIIKNHEGIVHVTSTEGQGTFFQILLPVSQNPTSQSPVQRLTIQRNGSGKILLVDDEEIVRDVASDMIRSLGYDVVTASGGQEAIDYFSKHTDEIDMAIIDVIMPGVGGRECFLGLKNIDPHVRAVLSSGYGQDGRAQEIINEGMLGFIQKPYQLTTLAEGLQKALDG